MSSILPLLFFASKRGVDVVIVIIITIIIIFFGKEGYVIEDGREEMKWRDESVSLSLSV